MNPFPKPPIRRAFQPTQQLQLGAEQNHGGSVSHEVGKEQASSTADPLGFPDGFNPQLRGLVVRELGLDNKSEKPKKWNEVPGLLRQVYLELNKRLTESDLVAPEEIRKKGFEDAVTSFSTSSNIPLDERLQAIAGAVTNFRGSEATQNLKLIYTQNQEAAQDLALLGMALKCDALYKQEAFGDDSAGSPLIQSHMNKPDESIKSMAGVLKDIGKYGWDFYNQNLAGIRVYGDATAPNQLFSNLL
jgi:hypothetical protein